MRGTPRRGPPYGESYFTGAYGGIPGGYAARATPNKWRSICGFIAEHASPFTVAADVGCAEGLFLQHAVRSFPSVSWSGSDVSSYAVGRARAANPGLDVRECSATALSFDDGAFDLVTALDVLEHIPDLSAALAQLARILRPGGALVATVPVYDGPLGWLVHRLDRDQTHVHRQTREFWLAGPLAQRFELVAWQGAWRYYLGRYWHFRATLGKNSSPAIVMAWRRRA